MIILASMIDEPGDLVKFQTLYSLYSGAMLRQRLIYWRMQTMPRTLFRYHR